MGLFLCPIHGGQGFLEMCVHLWETLENGDYPEMKELTALHLKLCDTCFAENGVGEIKEMTLDELLELPEEEAEKYGEQVYSIYQNIDRRSQCIQCIKTIELNHARKHHKELPFEAYENTLTYQNKEKIEALENILNANYSFQEFKITSSNTARRFNIRNGTITYPLSISFYCITEKKDQLALLKLIDDFFEDIPQKQRAIRFYEADNWITKELENATSHSKGEDKLLLEKIVL